VLTRGIHEIGEHEGRQEPVRGSRLGRDEGTHPDPLDQHAGLVAHRVAVVSRRTVEHVVGTPFQEGSVLELGSPLAREHHAHVMRLAPGPFGERPGVVQRPAPARLLHGAADGEAGDLDDLLGDAFEPDRLIRFVEALAIGTTHPAIFG
jgi:hypothetical protein